jgi:hypothetical protein
MIKSHPQNSFSFRIEDDFCNVFVQVLALAQTARFLESLKLMLYRAQTTTTFFFPQKSSWLVSRSAHSRVPDDAPKPKHKARALEDSRSKTCKPSLF